MRLRCGRMVRRREGEETDCMEMDKGGSRTW